MEQQLTMPKQINHEGLQKIEKQQKKNSKYPTRKG